MSVKKKFLYFHIYLFIFCILCPAENQTVAYNSEQ